MKYIPILLLFCGCKVSNFTPKYNYTVNFGTNNIQCNSYYVTPQQGEYKIQCYSDDYKKYVIFETLVTNYTVVKN